MARPQAGFLLAELRWMKVIAQSLSRAGSKELLEAREPGLA